MLLTSLSLALFRVGVSQVTSSSGAAESPAVTAALVADAGLAQLRFRLEG
jgi:hypothetical protein